METRIFQVKSEEKIKPLLVCPGGSFEKAKVALSYGADAVYVASGPYGLRAGADNLSREELGNLAAFAHARRARVYVVLNAVLHDEDFEGIDDFSRFLGAIGIDAAVVSDAGVLGRVQKNCAVPIYLSTQASCLNSGAASVWKALGVRRIILGREVSLAEAAEIKERANIEVEVFIHGAMCMAYSGHCALSTFTAGRDANRGGCVHSCRFPYRRDDEAEPDTLLSSKDLAGLELLPEAVARRIDALKVEGRMKSALYVGTVTKVYREALDRVFESGLGPADLRILTDELEAVPHRDLSFGWLAGLAGPDTVYHPPKNVSSKSSCRYAGMVLRKENDSLALRLHAGVCAGTPLELVPFSGKPVAFALPELRDEAGNLLERGLQNTVVYISAKEVPEAMAPLQVLRMRLEPWS